MTERNPMKPLKTLSRLSAETRQSLSSGQTAGTAIHNSQSPLAPISALHQQLNQIEALLAGPGEIIQTLLQRPSVTDILINPGNAWVEEAGDLQPIPELALEPAAVRELAVRLAAAAGTRLDEAKPIADGTLPDGTRLNAVIEPLCPAGALISLRTKRPVSYQLDELTNLFPGPTREILDQLVEKRASTLISGATGSGKTTLLSAVLNHVSPQHRLITIEDVPELNPTHPHTVSLLSKQPNIQGEGEITLAQLVQTALRMRPDRIILGECRGPEIRDLLAALNTGHLGSWGTIHANSALDVPARLEALGALAGMPTQSVGAQAVAGIDAIIHLTRTPEGRKISQIGVFAITLPLRVKLLWETQTQHLDNTLWTELQAKLAGR